MGVKENWTKAALEKELDALSLEMNGVSDKIGTSLDTANDATVFGRIMLAIDSMNHNVSSQADRIISAVKAVINASAAEAAGFGDGSYGELSTRTLYHKQPIKLGHIKNHILLYTNG